MNQNLPLDCTPKDNFEIAMSADYWRSVALYLADCHAATAYDYEAKSASKAKRDRMISILETCIAAINKNPNKCRDHPRSDVDVTERCMKTVTMLHNANAMAKKRA